jgi:hypothetical protein
LPVNEQSRVRRGVRRHRGDHLKCEVRDGPHCVDRDRRPSGASSRSWPRSVFPSRRLRGETDGLPPACFREGGPATVLRRTLGE